MELATAAAERFSSALLSSDTAGFEEGFQQVHALVLGSSYQLMLLQHESAVCKLCTVVRSEACMHIWHRPSAGMEKP